MPVYRRKWKDKETGTVHLGSYYFKFDVDGVTYKETVKTARTKRQAEEAEMRAREEVHEGTYGVRNKKRLFSAFVNDVYIPHMEQHNKKVYDTKKHAEMLCRYFEGRTLTQISPLAIETFKRDRLKTPTMHDKQRKPATVNAELTVLSAVFTLAVREKLLKENPCSKVSWLETDEGPCRRLSPEEEQSLLQTAEASSAWYLKPMIQLALWTGLRQGEIIALRRDAIDFSRNRLYVRNPKWKRDKRRTEGVPLGADVRALLEELCHRAQNDLLFPNTTGGQLTRNTVLSAFVRTCAKAGIKNLRFHDLRHEYGSRLGDADVNMQKIAMLMGHANTRQTERYVHPDDQGLLSATEIASKGRTRIVPGRLKAVIGGDGKAMAQG